MADLLGKDSYSNSKNQSYLFTGFAFCANCGGLLYHRECKHKSGSNVYWQCINRNCRDKRNINERELVTAVHEILKSHMRTVLRSSKPLTADMVTENIENDIVIKGFNDKIKQINDTKAKLSAQIDNGTVTAIEYEEMNSFYDSKIVALNAQKESILCKKKKMINCIDEISARFEKYCELPELTREIIVTFIDKVVVESKSSINIFFRYADFFAQEESGGENSGS